MRIWLDKVLHLTELLNRLCLKKLRLGNLRTDFPSTTHAL